MKSDLIQGLIFIALVCVAGWWINTDGYLRGYETAELKTGQALADLRAEHERLRGQAAAETLAQLQAQQALTHAAEAKLIDAEQALAERSKPLTRERIIYVSNPTPNSADVLITCGWLREYNQALGADLPPPAVCAIDAQAQTKTWPATGTHAELSPSGVSLADVLAHARDYGQWAQGAVARLNAVLDVHEKDPH